MLVQLQPGQEADITVLQLQELSLHGLLVVDFTMLDSRETSAKFSNPNMSSDWVLCPLYRTDNKNFMATFSFSISISNVES